jgi:hypothetical protein
VENTDIGDFSHGLSYLIINDIGYKHYVEKDIFTPIDELREEKINNILK